MRLFLLTVLTMIAFAANSVLNRMALAGGGMDAISFGTVRLMAGAAMLTLLCLMLRGRLALTGPGRLVGVLSLLVYLYGFSLAYNALDAGLGALILFGTVQVTMFTGALIRGEAMPPRRWLGAGLAFGGLIWLLWPGGAVAVSPLHGALMALAGAGWGIYSLAGQRADDALQATAANFVLGAPLVLLFWVVLPFEAAANPRGIGLAVLSGAVTSGMGYALWYNLLPRLAAAVAAVAQLSVPIIATLGGVALLGEVVGLSFAFAAALVLGGVAISVLPAGSQSS